MLLRAISNYIAKKSPNVAKQLALQDSLLSESEDKDAVIIEEKSFSLVDKDEKSMFLVIPENDLEDDLNNNELDEEQDNSELKTENDVSSPVMK
ncbi:hypothetical protein FQR65_LT03752 [Abscondita terminalis]|nr:hypothetical protein FQR65_LT03752 [Abscondita terminalis]